MKVNIIPKDVIRIMPIASLRDMAKNDDVYLLSNAYNYLKRMYDRSGMKQFYDTLNFNTCWRFKPLSMFINDNKTDDQVAAFICTVLMDELSAIIKLEEAV